VLLPSRIFLRAAYISSEEMFIIASDERMIEGLLMVGAFARHRSSNAEANRLPLPSIASNAPNCGGY
jgi:hypothetical protein